MNGRVDQRLRALLDVRVRSTQSGPPTSISVWIDTAFNGHFVFPERLINELGLLQEAATEAILADGSLVTMESYVCYVDWFGQVLPAQVIANEGQMPLLGTELLAKHVLKVDYIDMKVLIS